MRPELSMYLCVSVMFNNAAVLYVKLQAGRLVRETVARVSPLCVKCFNQSLLVRPCLLCIECSLHVYLCGRLRLLVFLCTVA